MDENGLLGEDYNLEKDILEKHVRAVNAAIIANGLNSRGCPPKSPAGDAQKPGKDSNGKELCTNFKAGKCTRDNCKYSHGENTSRGGTSRGGAPKGGEKCTPKGGGRDPEAAYNAIPNEFGTRCFKAKPPICIIFAYYGRCAESSAASCTSSADKPLRHVCSKCEFADGPHAITNGSCPNWANHW